jgi:tetratricopeptide (TPR) repeat protein
LVRRELAIFEISFGTEHPTVATALNNLAQLLQDTNRLAEAEPLMRRALAVDEKSLGAEHPDVARDLHCLALLLQDTNRLAEAEPLMRRAVAILLRFRHSTGYEHRDQARFSDDYRRLLKKMGKSDSEVETTLQALRLASPENRGGVVAALTDEP